MQRRTFIKHLVLTGTTIMFPQLLEAGFTKREIKKAIEVAYYASKLNPVRLFAGLVFDSIAEVYVEPMAKRTFDSFIGGKSVSKNQIASYTPSSPKIITKMKEIEYEPYKASVVVYSGSEYKIEREKKVHLELIANFDKKRFVDIHKYFKDEKIKVKLYNSEVISTVGSDFTPTELFDIDYIVYGDIQKETHIANLLIETENSAFREFVV